MAGITVNSISISELLDHLREREWLAPKFQREFLWSIEEIKLLINSIINGHPIGMVTLWAQPDIGALELEPLSIPDNTNVKYFATSQIDAKKKYAILDGKQRSTSIAMAFGGFHADNSRYKYSGRFFLNVNKGEVTNRIEYFKDGDLSKNNMETEVAQITKGYFPLFTDAGKNLNEQWMFYISTIRNPKFYENGIMPDDDELKSREEILRKAFNGIIDTKIAVYIVPERFNLGEICEIFETLNTTGTKVSPVDLIHSWLYSDTSSDPEGPILLREWIQDMSERDGSLGWADIDKRPELMAQISTACYVAQDAKSTPRSVGGRTGKTPINTVKAGDLLATPKEHWKLIIKNEERIAEYLGDFQDLVANGRFPWIRCPYPVTAAIYVALRWYKYREDIAGWGIDDLNALYKAFFWKNALVGRYDQGFLTQLGTDINVLKTILHKRKDYAKTNMWVDYANQSLEKLIFKKTPDKEQLLKYISDGRPGGAIQKAIQLLLYTKPKNDLVSQTIKLNYNSNFSAELHHIYTKNWCKYHISNSENVKGKEKFRYDWVNSAANLMLLSRDSNNFWKKRSPATAIKEKKIEFNNSANLYYDLFIDEEAFRYLVADQNEIIKFWERRANIIADEIIARLTVSL